MDPVTSFLSAHLPTVFMVMGVCGIINTVVDAVIRPWVAETATKRDDVILETYVDPPLKLVARLSAFVAMRVPGGGK